MYAALEGLGSRVCSNTNNIFRLFVQCPDSSVDRVSVQEVRVGNWN